MKDSFSWRRYGVHSYPKYNSTRRSDASLRHRNRAATTVLVCEQKPYSLWFSWRQKSYPVKCVHRTYPIYNSFLWRGVPSLRHRNRAATTVLVCEQKPYLVRFSWRCKSDPILTLYGRWAVVQANLRNKINFLSAYRHIHGTWGPHKWTLVTVLKAGA